MAGVVFGYVLQRSQLCFHATFAGLYERRPGLFRAWLLGVAISAVGLTVIYGLGVGDLNEGLSFRPVHNVVGGLLIGAGMVIAMSCVSGLYFKLGAGMLGALVGLAAWAGGELAARDLRLPGDEVVLDGGSAGTVPGWLGDTAVDGGRPVRRAGALVAVRPGPGDATARSGPGSGPGRWPAWRSAPRAS